MRGAFHFNKGRVFSFTNVRQVHVAALLLATWSFLESLSSCAFSMTEKNHRALSQTRWQWGDVTIRCSLFHRHRVLEHRIVTTFHRHRRVFEHRIRSVASLHRVWLRTRWFGLHKVLLLTSHYIRLASRRRMKLTGFSMYNLLISD